ncbi:transmembrane protein 151B-like isoform X2 [Brevipalpus obovatus]
MWCNVSQITRLMVNVQSLHLNNRRRTNSCDEGYIYIPIVFVIMLYLTYLVECFHSSTRMHLASQTDVETARNYIRQLRNTQPLIWWKSICYHYIRRTRQISRYRNGESFTTTQIYYERINTHIAGSCFSYGTLGEKDVSRDLVDLDKHPSTRIKFSKGFAFATMDAAAEFESQRSRFIRESERHDDYLEMREGLDLIGCNFQESLTVTVDKNSVPWFFSHMTYWIFSFLLLSWPIRIIIELKTAHVHYQVIKLFGINHLDPQFPNRLESVDSLELCCNNIVAPSYSEALLMSSPSLTVANCGDRSTTQVNNIDPAKFGCDSKSAQRCTDRNSIPRASSVSLLNGRIVYLPCPFKTHLASTSRLITRTSSTDPIIFHEPSQIGKVRQDQPPSYDEVITDCHLLVPSDCSPQPLRRSFTDRNIFRRLNDTLRRPWGTIHDFFAISKSHPIDL